MAFPDFHLSGANVAFALEGDERLVRSSARYVCKGTHFLRLMVICRVFFGDRWLLQSYIRWLSQLSLLCCNSVMSQLFAAVL